MNIHQSFFKFISILGKVPSPQAESRVELGGHQNHLLG